VVKKKEKQHVTFVSKSGLSSFYVGNTTKSLSLSMNENLFIFITKLLYSAI